MKDRVTRHHQVIFKLSAGEHLLFRAVVKRRGFRNMAEMVRYLVRRHEEDTRPGRDESAFERMVRQTRGLALLPCEFEGEPCHGCASCFARETVRLLDA